MTRRDYVLIAQSIRKCASLGQDNLYYIADMVANDLQKDNPAFKYDVFLEACGVTQETIERAKE